MMKNIPVYKHTAAYAREHDELAAYRASNQVNVACKEAIEATIRDHYRDNRLDTAAVDQVVQQFGYDRAFHILAITVCQADWDRRYSPDNRAWANAMSIPANPDAWGTDRNCYSAWNTLAEQVCFGNRVFSHFAFMQPGDKEKDMDRRMYRQSELAEHYVRTVNIFGVGSPVAKASQTTVGLSKALAASLSAVLSGVVYVFVCLKALGGAFGIGSVTQYVSAVTTFSGNAALLLSTVSHMRANAEFLKTIYTFLDIPNSMYQGSLTTEKRSDRQYDVEFRDVSFRYPGSDIWALRHVNMRFKVGKRLAIVGENGSGKTTFIKLLCRLYDPQEGQILLNGIDIRKYRYDDYMGIFSVVFQDFQLICQPLGANVAGSMEYDRDRARKALIDAGFADRLAAMEKGLDTMLYKNLSEDGVEVSGGEAQKIAIARALYKDAPFIILDEPTAALDPIAEAEIYSKFDEIAGNKTAIYISHRLSSCKFCDEIAVFHEGAVIQQGSHAELLADRGGKYYALWNAQAQYYTE